MDAAQIAAMIADREAGTPGPWSVFIDDSGDRWTGWPLSVNCDVIEDKTIVRTGGMWPYEWDAKTSQHEACANARRIARVPDMEATIIAQAAELERLRAERDAFKMLQFAAETFCNRVDIGEIRSKRTYAAFKDALAKIGGAA